MFVRSDVLKDVEKISRLTLYMFCVPWSALNTAWSTATLIEGSELSTTCCREAP